MIPLLDVARPDWPKGGAVYVGIHLGFRREEMASLRWRDFSRDLGWVTIVGKHNRTHQIPVHPKLKAKLAAQRWPGEYVFPGRLGGHVSGTTISNWIHDIGVKAGLGHIHPHQLRYTAGGKINDETRDIHAAQQWLGHAKVETTQTYTRERNDRLLAAMATLNWEDHLDVETVDEPVLVNAVHQYLTENREELLRLLTDTAA